MQADPPDHAPAGSLLSSGLAQLRERLDHQGAAPPVAFVVRADGTTAAFGRGEPAFDVTVKNDAGMRAVLSLRELAIAEAYMRDDVEIEGDLFQAMSLRELLSDNRAWLTTWSWLKPMILGRERCNPAWIAKHYDAGDMQLIAADRRYHSYTPGIYEGDDDTLEAGAERKFGAAFQALGLGPGASVLDVGCGWGGFVRYCASRGVDVTGITLSAGQFQYVQECLASEGLEADVRRQDFFSFEPGRRFDGITMMGALEDLSDYGAVMGRVRRWLQPEGALYCDFAASNARFGVSSFITKYVWPGTFRLIHLPTFFRAIGRASLEVVGMWNDRRNYELWVRKVHDRWVERKADVLNQFDEATWRMFRLLCAGVAATMSNGSDRATAYRILIRARRAQGARRRSVTVRSPLGMAARLASARGRLFARR